MEKFLCDDNITCLPINVICNDKWDCKDGSDEASLCKSNKTCDSLKCPSTAQCKILPKSGPTCICPLGYEYSLAQNLCIDINECTRNLDTCSQFCINVPGSYKCNCNKNYLLQSDRRSCTMRKPEDSTLYYTTQVSVMGVRLKTKRLFTIASSLRRVVGIATDGLHLYWTNIQNEGESITKSNIDGSNDDILFTAGLEAPEDLAVDWLTGKFSCFLS